jgi:hypothetical protein
MSIQVYPSRGHALAYGSYSDSTSQPLTASTVTYVKFDTVEAQQFVSVQNDGSGFPTKVVVGTSGIFSFTISPQLLHGGGGSALVDFFAVVNGTAVPRSASRLRLPNNTETLPFFEIIIQMTVGDAFQWAFYSTSSTVSIYATAASSPIPAAPSAIAGVKQIE